MNRIALLLPFAALLIGGCATTRPASKQPPAPVVAVQMAPVDPSLTGANAIPAPQVARSDFAGTPVRSLGRVRRINLEPYVDENGNAYGPQVKYVYEAGGWDMDAVRNPSKAYIPTELQPEVPQPAAIVVANTGQDIPKVPTKSLRELYNLKDVVVTGFVERSQEPIVREMAAKADKIPYFDEESNLGWLLIPKSALQPPGS